MPRLRRVLRRFIHDALALLLPFRCAACGRLPAPGSMNATPGEGEPAADTASPEPLMRLLCPDCRSTVVPVSPPLCHDCGRPFSTSAGGNHRCGECVRDPLGFGKMRSAGVYAGAMVPLMRRFKYYRAVHLAAAMGQWMSAVYERDWQHESVALVVPVPLHRRRIRHRGYNQAWLLARKAFHRRSTDAVPLLRHDVLTRVRDTPPQAGLDSVRRRQNLAGAFHVAEPRAVAGKHVLVVDDVVTTGETMAACGGALLAAGAHRIDALVAARTLRRIQ